jgi:L-ascorbate metabolism protein UlaG (beta-lactamase superfamily)
LRGKLSLIFIFLVVLSLAPLTVRSTGPTASGRVYIRWLGHAAVEIATSDYEKMVYIDPYIIGNPAWGVFHVPVPDEYSSITKLVTYVAGKKPDVVLILITHDHSDHTGVDTYGPPPAGGVFDFASGLYKAGVNVQVVAMYELALYIDKWLASNYGVPAGTVVITGGGGMNIGGKTTINGVTVAMTDARHSSSESGVGVPAAGYVVTIGGVRIYHAGDTGLFGDMQLIHELYKPEIAFLPIGDLFTMGPSEAAIAAKYISPRIAIPIHYATWTPPLLGPEAAQEFKDQVRGPTRVLIPLPGELIKYP